MDHEENMSFTANGGAAGATGEAVGQNGSTTQADLAELQGADAGYKSADSSAENGHNQKEGLSDSSTKAQASKRKKKMILWSLVAFVAILAIVAAITAPIEVHEHESASPQSSSASTNGSKPNIVFIFTDDQDAQMTSLDYMPNVQSLLVAQGTTYPRHYCTVSLCCPSRVNLWTGRAAHNTNVTDLSPPYGGYPKFASQGLNSAWLPLWMQAAGYRTYYTGKLMNSHSIQNYDSPYAAGFDGSDFLLEPGTYSYWDPIFQRDQDAPVNHTNEYNTDLVTSKALGFLDDAVNTGDPFMLTIAPIAPHGGVTFTHKGLKSGPPEPNTQYLNSYPNISVPRTPNFNPDQPSGVSWVARLPQQNDTVVASNDEWFAARVRALLSVDDMVNQTIAKLESYGILDNTYIFFSSDNGYHIGQHRLHPGKSCPFETDVNIPLIVRGPNVPQNYTAEVVSSHTDLAPTFLGIAGASPRDDFDGTAIPLTEDTINTRQNDGSDEYVNIEYWGIAPIEGSYGTGVHPNNTYKTLRLVGSDYSLYYAVWCNNEHEMYDMIADPYQMNNIYNSSQLQLLNNATTVANVIPRLDALLMVLKSCKAESCQSPWQQLHPAGAVKNLNDALNSQFDSFYSAQTEVSFNWCDKGYIVAAEGPQNYKVFGNSTEDFQEFNSPDWSILA